MIRASHLAGVGLKKKELSEQDICSMFIGPALKHAGWDKLSQIREEVGITKGRIIVRGRLVTRGRAKRADYVLYIKPNIPLALIEAKDNTHAVGDGMQQGLEYATTLDIPFVFSSNGDTTASSSGARPSATGCRSTCTWVGPSTRCCTCSMPASGTRSVRHRRRLHRRAVPEAVQSGHDSGLLVSRRIGPLPRAGEVAERDGRYYAGRPSEPQAEKMSKSRGNVVNPDDMVRSTAPTRCGSTRCTWARWRRRSPGDGGVNGVCRFLNARLAQSGRRRGVDSRSHPPCKDVAAPAGPLRLHRTIKKVDRGHRRHALQHRHRAS